MVRIPAVLWNLRSWCFTEAYLPQLSNTSWNTEDNFPDKCAGWKHHSRCPCSLCRCCYLPGCSLSMHFSEKAWWAHSHIFPGLHLGMATCCYPLHSDYSKAFLLDILAEFWLKLFVKENFLFCSFLCVWCLGAARYIFFVPCSIF